MIPIHLPLPTSRGQPVTITKNRLLIVLILVPGALTVVGCGDSKSNNADQTTSTVTQAQTTTQPAQQSQSQAPKVVRAKPTAAEADLGRKPKPPKGKGSPPATLIAQDLIVGKGRKAAAGETVSVQYVGVLFSNGRQFDASWKGNRPGKAFQFALGSGQVIPGWDQGVAGMRAGGRRKLIIPADLAYGAQGYPPSIPANAALVFDIDLKKVRG